MGTLCASRVPTPQAIRRAFVFIDRMCIVVILSYSSKDFNIDANFLPGALDYRLLAHQREHDASRAKGEASTWRCGCLVE